MTMRVAVKPYVPQELGYAQITASVTQTGAGNQDVAGLSVTVNCRAGRTIEVIAQASSLGISAAGGIGAMNIVEGGTTFAGATVGLAAAGTTFAAYVTARLTPTAGSHTYKVNLTQIITGNTTLGASATSPAYIWVREV